MLEGLKKKLKKKIKPLEFWSHGDDLGSINS